MNDRHTLAAAGLGIVAILVAREVDRERSSPPPPSRLGEVTVAVFDDGAPLADRWVVFHDREGAVLASVRSDREGKAKAIVPEGGSVTVAFGTSLWELVTVMAVVPGETVVVGDPEGEGGVAQTQTTADARLPRPFVDAARHRISVGAGAVEIAADAGAVRLPILSRLLTGAPDGGSRFPVLAEAFGANDEPLGFAAGWGSAHRLSDDGGGRSAEPPETPVVLPGWSTSYRDIALVVVNAEPETTVTARLDMLEDHAHFERPPRTARVARGRGATRVVFRVPDALTGEVITRVDVARDGSSERAVVARRSALAATSALDLATALLPRVSDPRAEPSSDPARPILTWTRARGSDQGPTAHATLVRLGWPATKEHRWTILAPPEVAPRLRVPELPHVLERWRPLSRPPAAGRPSEPMTAAVAVLSSSTYRGYDDVRRRGVEALGEVLETSGGWLRWSGTEDFAF